MCVCARALECVCVRVQEEMGGWVWNARVRWCEGNVRDRDQGGGSSTLEEPRPDEVRNVSQLTLSGGG